MKNLSPTIAIVGSGAASVGITQALRNHQRFASTSAHFKPKVTVFESSSEPGGKMAPRNLGAQFLDEEKFYPMNRILKDLGLRLHRPRVDYDQAPYQLRSGEVMSAVEFEKTLAVLRQCAAKALRSRERLRQIDHLGAIGFLHQLKNQGILSPQGVEAMISRTKFEEGTIRMSALAFAINLAHGKTPVRRVEVVGGLQKIALAEKEAVENDGGTFLLGKTVRRVEAFEEGVRLYLRDERRPLLFDYVFIAISPEHYKYLQIAGSSMPYQQFLKFMPARITKTNVLLPIGAAFPQEIATEEYARWLTPGDLVAPGDRKSPRRKAVTFFHGWEGQKRLSDQYLLREAGKKQGHYVSLESRTWDGKAGHGEIGHTYTTLPLRGQAFPLYQWTKDYYVRGVYDGERIHFANHTLGLGCYTRDAALSGERAVISMLRSMGYRIVSRINSPGLTSL